MAQYRTGTVTATNGDATITGSGTLFASNVQAGDLFSIGSDSVYTVASVTNDTALELTSNYAGTTETAGAGQSRAYAISRDFTPNQNLPFAQPGDINTARIYQKAFTQIDTFFTDGTRNLSINNITSTGLSTLAQVDINSGSIDNTNIGAVLPANGTFNAFASATSRVGNSSVSIGYTSLNTSIISQTSNAGLLIDSGSSGLGAVTFGDGAFASRIIYNHSTDILAIQNASSLTTAQFNQDRSSDFFGTVRLDTLEDATGGGIDINDLVTFSNGFIVNDPDVFGNIILNNSNASPHTMNVLFQEGGVPQWQLGPNFVDDSFRIDRYNTSGTFVDTPIFISQSTGQVQLRNDLIVGAVFADARVSLYESAGTGITLEYNAVGNRLSLLGEAGGGSIELVRFLRDSEGIQTNKIDDITGAGIAVNATLTGNITTNDNFRITTAAVLQFYDTVALSWENSLQYSSTFKTVVVGNSTNSQGVWLYGNNSTLTARVTPTHFRVDASGIQTNQIGDVSGGLSLLPTIIKTPNLPTSDPLVAGQWWNNRGVLTISAG